MGQCMKYDLHLIYFEMGCGTLDFSVLDSLFFGFEALHSLIFYLKPFLKGQILRSGERE